MRADLPLTGREIELNEGESIVSQTDLKGRITYINPAFVEVSGFEREELIGTAHNIVRHPDMPREAFADLWRTVQAGLPWTGIVQNRCKNGDHYWVVANVTPIRAGGRPTGYMSVRTKPSRVQIAKAEALYRHLRAGNADGVALRHGAVERRGVAGLPDRLLRLPLRARLGAALGGPALLFLAVAVLAAAKAPAAWTAALAIVGAAAALSAWRALGNALETPLRLTTEAAQDVAAGDLATPPATGRGGEIGRLLEALQQMKVNLRAIVGDVRADALQIDEAASRIAADNRDLAARTDAQAAGVEEMAASIEELSGTVRQNAAHAEEANGLAASASLVAARGGEAFDRIGATMGEITASSKRISDITGLIDGIAFQTNILALNAAVEAARAGEHGLGFAVVADEVRRLALHSAERSREIQALIEASTRQITEGSRLVSDAGQTMGEIVRAVDRVTAIMSDISEASRQQSDGVDQVNRAVTEIDRTTQANGALVAETARRATSLEESARRLSEAIAVFRLEA